MPHLPPAVGDQTVAFDTMLVERLTHCTLCGRPSLGHHGLWAGWGPVRRVTLAYLVCARCRVHDPHGVAVDAKLRRRYTNYLEIGHD